MSLEERVGTLLTRRGWKIAVAETTCGGLICRRLTRVPGSSRYLDRGIVAYSTASKLDLLGVSEEMIDRFGAVSQEVAVAMADGVRRLGKTQIGIAETGLAGPIQGRSSKAVGSAFLAMATPSGTLWESSLFRGSRLQIQEQIARRAIEMIAEYLETQEGDLNPVTDG